MADQLLQLVGGLLFHVLVAVTIDVKGEGDCRMAQRFGQGLRIDVALQGQRGECVPLGYNNDKTGNPYGTRVLSDSGC